MATCGQMVEGNVVSFMCDLEPNHDGPHRAIENARSVRERAKWETEQLALHNDGAEARETLAQFQGPAQTTAERYTENATPVPGAGDRVPPLGPDRGPEDDLPEVEEPGPEHERPVVYTEDRAGERFRPATPAEAKVAGLDDSYLSGPTKQREGDQPLPTKTEAEYVQDRIIAKITMLRDEGLMEGAVADSLIAQMRASKEVGTQRYGTPLQTFNGRDCLQDAIEEARDLYVYLSSMDQARDASRERLTQVAQEAMEAEWMVGAAEERVDSPKGHTTRLAEVAVDAILKATGGFDI